MRGPADGADDEPVLAFGTLSLLHAVSAVLGFRWTSRCKRLHRDWQRDNPV